MSASDFTNKGKLQRNTSGLHSHLSSDNGKMAVIIKSGSQVIKSSDMNLPPKAQNNPLSLQEVIGAMESNNKVKFSGWSTQFQPKSLGSSIFLVFS